GELRPGIVHRLDAGTSGLLIVAKTDETYAAFREGFRHHTIDRRYLALVRGQVPHDRFGVEAPLGRRAAKIVVDRVDGRPATTSLTCSRGSVSTSDLDAVPRRASLGPPESQPCKLSTSDRERCGKRSRKGDHQRRCPAQGSSISTPTRSIPCSTGLRASRRRAPTRARPRSSAKPLATGCRRSRSRTTGPCSARSASTRRPARRG